MIAVTNRGGWELPPRARRIRGIVLAIDVQLGTTSACAENTCRLGQMWSWLGNYLRVRGEYCGFLAAELVDQELPPRARRIPETIAHKANILGTTSACAENTTRA